MAKPIHLKANTPGGNSYTKSRANQKVKDGTITNQRFKPALRPFKAKRSADSAVGKATISKADMRPRMAPKKVVDYTSSWMGAHGLLHAQNAGQKPRLPFASVPADLIGAAAGTMPKSSVKKSVSRKASVNPSGRTTAKRVKTSYTGKSFKTSPRSKVVSARKTP